MEFSKLPRSVFSCVMSWVRSLTEPQKKESYSTAFWEVLLCVCVPAHFLGCDWLLIYQWIYLYTNISFSLILAQGLYYLFDLKSWPTGLEYTLCPFVFPDMQIRSGVSWLWWAVGQDHLTWIPKASIHVMRAETGASWASGGCPPPGSNLLQRGWVYYLAFEASLFRGMPMGLEAFFEPPGMCRPQSCAWFPQ